MSTRTYQPHETTMIDGIAREVATKEIWQSRLGKIRAREKELTRAHDQLAAERRRAPWVRVERPYLFRGRSGEATLVELFQDRKQLIVSENGHDVDGGELEELRVSASTH